MALFNHWEQEKLHEDEVIEQLIGWYKLPDTEASYRALREAYNVGYKRGERQGQSDTIDDYENDRRL